MNVTRTLMLALAMGVFATTGELTAEPKGTAFTYQGRLQHDGTAVTDTCDFDFTLWDAAETPPGVLIGGPQAATLGVTDGLFMAELDFGGDPFNGEARWLELAVCCPSPCTPVPLSPRQELTPTPYAILAQKIEGGTPNYILKWASETEVADSVIYEEPGGNIGIGTTTPTQRLDVAGDIHASSTINALGAIASGSSITIDGTTDTITSTGDLEVHVSSGGSLRLEANATSPNLVGGYSGNTVTAGALGGTIGGGGRAGATNRVTDNFGTVSGGNWNTAGDDAGTTEDAWAATVGGGYINTASGEYATVSGGHNGVASSEGATVGGGNTNAATGYSATVGGGYGNDATGYSTTIGGGYDNDASFDFATIGGGFTNTASGSNATVGGGWANDGSGWCAAVGGGYDNTASGTHSVVGGGVSNQAISARSTVGGGEANVASGQFSTIGGGTLNNAIGYWSTVGGGANNEAGADYAVVPGGSKNTAGGEYGFAAGRRAKANHDGTFVWADSTDADFASTGTDQFLIRATGGVGLGKNNPSEQLDVEGNIHASGAITSGSSITIDGTTDTITSTGDLELHVSTGRALRMEPNATSPNIIGGYADNSVAAGVVGAAIGGGGEWTYANRVTDDFGTIGGGCYNRAGDSAGATDDATHATVSGGEQNVAGGSWSTVGGGESNDATGAYSTIGGGIANEASSSQSTVGGGILNLAIALNSTVSGGIGNEASGAGAAVGGGAENTATGSSAVIGGGVYNVAGGYRSTVPGGSNNTADGSYSFAAGRRAKTDVAHQGAFVWADSSDFDFTSTAADEFGARTTGGVRFVTAIDGAGAPTAGVKLDPGDNAWETLSDRNAKENFVTLDAREVLRRLGDMPVTQWNYKGQDPSDKHIGPMAQDFYAAFGLSADDRHISTIDADGVALAAIQGLHEIVKEKDAKIADLEARLTALEDVVAAITLKRAQTGGGR